jgi:uncharacterized protein YutE (UPF0331/DUF86 family)
MVDAERLHRLLRRVMDDRAVLSGYADAHDDLRADPVRLGHVKYVFVTMLEACVDTAQHVCASEGYGPPDSNAHAVRLLARHGHLEAELGERIARAIGFRNILVHGYADVDDGLVVDNLQRLADVRSYVAALTELIDNG